MDINDHFPFVAGMIEGLAYARYIHDNAQTAGMKCIYDWFYESGTAMDTIYVVFSEFRDSPPAAVLSALLDQKCEAE